ncbi:MAG TPA: ABC transporter ATP-binding protein [Candidatus Bathyarchaeia archaeon]|nr:ABC transporter ATP-binding protein [Candidatus Bathyarchaeia archaeon]
MKSEEKKMLLEIKNLTVRVKGNAGAPIVSNVNVTVGENEIVALVGASGSGKTTTGLAIMRLLPDQLERVSGQIIWKGRELNDFSLDQMRQLRGAEMAMIFQEPLDAFDPLFRIKEQMEEVLAAHTPLNRVERASRIKELLSQAGITDTVRVAESYPHQLSGGLRQRAMISQGLAGSPHLLIADEPTSSIDVTLQVKVMDLFRRLKKEFGLSVVLITHDLGVVRHLADRVYVMNQGRIVEQGLVSAVMDHPQEEYTRRLIEATA